MPQTVTVREAESQEANVGDIVDYHRRVSGPYMVCETAGDENKRYWLDLKTGKLHACVRINGNENRILPPGTRLVIEV